MSKLFAVKGVNIYIFHKWTKVVSKRSKTIHSKGIKLTTWSKNYQNPQNLSKLLTVTGVNIYIFHQLTKIDSKRSTVKAQNLHTWSKNDQNPQNLSKLFTVKGVNIYIFHQWTKVAEKFVKTMHNKCTKLTHKLYVSNFVFQELKSSQKVSKIIQKVSKIIQN